MFLCYVFISSVRSTFFHSSSSRIIIFAFSFILSFFICFLDLPPSAIFHFLVLFFMLFYLLSSSYTFPLFLVTGQFVAGHFVADNSSRTIIVADNSSQNMILMLLEILMFHEYPISLYTATAKNRI